MVKIILGEGLYNREFMDNWVNWEEYLKATTRMWIVNFENFIVELREEYAEFTPEFAENECGVKADMIGDVAIKVLVKQDQDLLHITGAVLEWKPRRMGCYQMFAFSSMYLQDSVGTVGGTSPNSWNKFKPKFFDNPPAQKFWNEFIFLMNIHWHSSK